MEFLLSFLKKFEENFKKYLTYPLGGDIIKPSGNFKHSSPAPEVTRATETGKENPNKPERKLK